MNEIYSVESDGSPKDLQRIMCKDEDTELQRLLAQNLNLLPGSQIDPEQPLRWLLIQREMPVYNPATGDKWWSLDFLLVDQFGCPTLVECKRYNDPRSRREVIGQMMEYAANGRHYWSASELLSHAEASAGGPIALQDKLEALTKSPKPDPEQFFLAVEQNLSQSKLRLIFFLENSPMELRSIVDFLNDQLKDTEVLIVEARQYRYGGSRIIVPYLFGFTEEIRIAKRNARSGTGNKTVPGRDAFWADVGATHSAEATGLIRGFIAHTEQIAGCEQRWLKGCNLVFSKITANYLFGIRRNGCLEINHAGLRGQKFRIQKCEPFFKKKQKAFLPEASMRIPLLF